MIGHMYDDNSDDEMFDLFNTTPQTPIIRELKYCSIKHQDAIESLIFQSKHLDTLELKLKHVDSDILMLTKKHKEEERQWTELIFKNIEAKDQEHVNYILASHQNISTLTLQYEQTMENFIAGIPNLQKIVFKFTGDMERSFEDLSHIHELEIELADNGPQKRKLLEFFHQCVNLKVLKLNLISARANPRIMKTLLTTLKNLEELQLNDHSNRLDVAAETFEMIKAEGKNLKKFTMIIDAGKAEEIREKVNIFNDTKIRTAVIAENANLLQNDGYNAAVCIWKK
jgi:hypothetical protein